MTSLQLHYIENLVKEQFSGDASGHDWWHTHRVRQMAVHMAKKEQADADVCEMAALLHDVADWKYNTSEEAGLAVVKSWLQNAGVSATEITKIIQIIDQVSYKGAYVSDHADTIEAMVVQDADRLDAIGAIGIARAFAYGGSRSRAMYIPDAEPEMHDSAEAYKTSNSHTINHFYEKLLLLADRMKTASARQISKERHAYMTGFLEQFYKEWGSEG
jgi:uncharacterized protein